MITASDIGKMEFKPYKLKSPWDNIIGEPVQNASILMFSGPGSGKSTVALQMGDAFTLHGKVGYNAQEEGFSATLQNKLERLGLMNSAINFFECENIDELKKHVQKAKLDFLIVDSFTMYDKRLVKFEEFRTWCKKQNCVLVAIVQTTKEGKFYGNADAAFNVDCVLKVTDGKPSTLETGKNRLGELYEHEVDLRNKPVKAVKNPAPVKRTNPDPDIFEGLEFIEDDEEIRVNPAPTPTELYNSITDSIIELIESGKDLPWRKPWVTDSKFKASSATNFISNNAYRGINAFLLNFLKIHLDKNGEKIYKEHRYENPYWFTFKQIKDLSGKLKKGALGNPAYYFTLLYSYQQEDPKIEFSTNNKIKFIAWLNDNRAKLKLLGNVKAEDYADTHFFPMLRYYNLYSGEDVEGIDYKNRLNENKEPLSESERLEASELIFDKFPNKPPLVNLENKRAYYSISKDHINMPEFKLFNTGQEYYSTLFHEAVHSTGHKSRLNREFGGKFGDPKYSFEELIAEFGAVLLSAESGILFKTRDNSAAYLKSFKQRLTKEMKEDNKFFFRASSRAQAAVDLILDRDAEGVPAYRKVLEGTLNDSKKDSSENKSVEVPGNPIEIYFKTDKPVIGTYAIIEADELIPSHNKDCSQNSKHLISKGQPRDRSNNDLCNQTKLIAQKLNPSLITVGNKAFDGAPVVLPDGQVIQGNGRSISLKIAYDEHEKQAENYRSYLEVNASKFGFTRDQIESFDKPVLVREVKVSEKEAIRLGNIIDNSQAKTSRLDESKAYLRQLDEQKRQIIGRIINSSRGETLGEIIDDKGLDILSLLSGLDRVGLVKDNELTSDGKDFIRQLFSGLVFDSDINKDALKHFSKLNHNTKAGIERSYGYIIPFIDTERDITSILQKAIEIVQYVQNTDGTNTIKDFLSQGDVFTGVNKERFKENEIELADFLVNQSTQKSIKEAFQVYYFKNIGRADLINPVEKVSPNEAFQDAFVDAVRINPPIDTVSLYTPAKFKVGEMIRDYYDNEKYVIVKKEKRGWELKNQNTGKKVFINDYHGPRFLPNREATPSIELFRVNGSDKSLIYLGVCEQLDINSEYIKGMKGSFVMLTDQAQKTLYIIPPNHVKTVSGVVHDDNAEKLFKQWHNFSADEKDLEINWPEGSPQKIGTASRILYISDKIMRSGDGKGKDNYYKHDFDKGKRPVSVLGDMLIVENIKWNERGILN